MPNNQLDVERIRRESVGLVLGSDVRYLPEVGSTNEVARQLPPGSWQTGTTILTDCQTGGRGRRGRTWLAPRGSSLLLSVILARPQHVLQSDAAMIGALSVVDAIGRSTDLVAGLKWPNDVLIGGRKVSGILSEYSRQGNVDRMILGIGINVNFDPNDFADIPSSATSLQIERGSTMNRELLAADLFKTLDLWYRYLIEEPGGVFSAWASRMSMIGEALLVSDGRGAWSGIATGVQRDGGLQVRDKDGNVRTVYAADVSVRKPGDSTTL